MHDEAGAFDVAEKTDAEAGAKMRAFNESGQIGDDKRAAEFRAMTASATVGIDDAEIGHERGERIIGDFGACGGNYRNKCGFACVRVTHQANIGEQFEFEAKVALFTRRTVLMFARSLMPGLGKILITAAALRDQHTLSGHGEIGDGFTGLLVVSERADGNEQAHVRARVAGAVRAFAMPAAIRFKFAIVAVAEKRVVIGIRFEINAAAVATVASGRAAARNEFFAAKRDAAVAASAGLDQNFCFVNKHENHSPQRLPARRLPLKTIA